MVEIKLPQFGMGMTDGTITKWFKSEGESVTAGDLLCEIEAAKTNVEYESPVTGILTKILVQIDENVPVNTPIALFAEGELSNEAPSVSADQTVEVQRLVEVGPAGKVSPLARRLAEQKGVDLSAVKGTGPNGRIMKGDISDLAPMPLQSADTVQVEPRARKIARDHGIDLIAVIGSGPNGRIVTEDVLAMTAKPASIATSLKSATTEPTNVANLASDEATEEVFIEIKHSMMRKTIARRLTESKQTVPHFYLKASCRVDALIAARASINGAGQEKVSLNDLVIRAIAMALKEVPEANVVWDDKAMRQYAYVDIAVAVATPRGLVTPVVRRVDEKTIRQISVEVKDLAARGREGKLKPEEYQGGTTSISNLGMFGVEEFSAIINPPQSTIFAVGASMQQVIPIDGKPEIATMMTVTCSVDHRAVDGAVGAQLLAAFKRNIEDPVRILA